MNRVCRGGGGWGADTPGSVFGRSSARGSWAPRSTKAVLCLKQLWFSCCDMGASQGLREQDPSPLGAPGVSASLLSLVLMESRSDFSSHSIGEGCTGSFLAVLSAHQGFQKMTKYFPEGLFNFLPRLIHNSDHLVPEASLFLIFLLLELCFFNLF